MVGPFEIRGSRVICADAFDASPRLPVDSVDLVLTSPPYWGTRTYGHDHDDHVLDRWARETTSTGGPPSWSWYRRCGGALGREPKPEWYIAHLVELFALLKPALKSGGSVWVNLGDSYFARWSSVRDHGRRGLGEGPRQRRRTPSGGWLHDKQLMLMPARFAIAMQDDGWVLRNDVIWHKPNATPQPAADRLAHAHEHLFHFVPRTRGGRPRYHYDRRAAEPGARDVVTVPTGSPRGAHRATFPAKLIEPRIASSCPPGGVVLDPCCGSGTAPAVAVQLGRVGIGFEVSPEFAALARARLAEASSVSAPTAARPRKQATSPSARPGTIGQWPTIRSR
jgi:site-specific DNA-methyltransferase (cytosine-N4-specific)